MNLTVQLITNSRLENLNEEKGINVIGCCNHEIEALNFTAMNKPAIILLDYKVKQEDTALFINSLHVESPDSKVILCGKNLPDDIVLNCMFCAIYGYLESRDIEQFLYRAICAVGKGEAWISRRLVGLFVGKLHG